jgi:hypothetical protein
MEATIITNLTSEEKRIYANAYNEGLWMNVGCPSLWAYGIVKQHRKKIRKQITNHWMKYGV